MRIYSVVSKLGVDAFEEALDKYLDDGPNHLYDDAKLEYFYVTETGDVPRFTALISWRSEHA